MSTPYNQTLAPCGTPNARRRHARKNETCETCGPLKHRLPPAPCGTRGAKDRHRRNNETCTTCGTPATRTPAPCGTPGAYRRHLRHGEPIDQACAQAARDKTNNRRRDRRKTPARAYTTTPLQDLIENITFLLNAGEGTGRILQATGYTGREDALRERLRGHGHGHLATRILNPWELAA